VKGQRLGRTQNIREEKIKHGVVGGRISSGKTKKGTRGGKEGLEGRPEFIDFGKDNRTTNLDERSFWDLRRKLNEKPGNF